MEKIESIEKYEFEILEEIPKETIKDITTNRSEIHATIDYLSGIELGGGFSCSYYECICQFKGKSIWKVITKSWNNFEEILKIDDSGELDVTKKYLSNYNEEFMEYSNIILTQEFKNAIDEIYLQQGKFSTRFEKLDSYTRFFNVKDVIKTLLEKGISSKNEIIADKEKFLIEKLEEQRIEEEQSKKDKVNDEIELKRLYEEESKATFYYDYNTWEIDGNILSKKNKPENKYVFQKPINELLPFNWWENMPSYYGDISRIELYLTNKKINYNRHTKDRFYVIEFKDDKILLDTIAIPKARLIFFLKRADGTAQRMKFLKKMSARGLQILDKKSLDLYYKDVGYSILSMPFKAETKDGITYHIEFMSKEYDVSFDSLKNLLFGDDLLIGNPNINKLGYFVTEVLGETKTTLFDHMKRIKMLKTLGGGNEDE